MSKLTVTRGQIINDLIGLIGQLSQLQSSGTVFLSQKVSFGISKNLNIALGIKKDSEKFRMSEIVKYCEVDKNGKPIVVELKDDKGRTVQSRYKFKDEQAEEDFKNIYQEHLEEEINFPAFKISASELEKIENMPVVTLALLESVGIVSELQLA